MSKLVIDIENTTTKLGDRYVDYSPYNPNNKLVSIGYSVLNGSTLEPIQYFFLYHKELKTDIDNMDYYEAINCFKNYLKESDTIIAHNAKYDIQWLEEAGFDLSNHKIEDTMIREYVMARGRSDISFKLKDCCKRYGVAEKGELFEKYPDLQISEMPIGEVEEYGRADIQACAELYLAQEERLNQDSYVGLKPTIGMMQEFCRILVDMERNGVKIDTVALAKVKAEFEAEAEQLKFDLYSLVKRYMGDTPVNLDSPQQLSEVIYSRRLIAGREEEWIRTFNIGKDDRNKHLRRPKMSYNVYADHIKSMSQHVLKTEALPCQNCSTKGVFQKFKKNGTPWKKETRCKDCYGKGYIYKDINEVAGFRMKPKNIAFTTVSGFSTSQTFLEELIEQAIETNKPDAKEFLEKLQRLSSISSYLSNFVGGISTFMQHSTDLLHPNFNQCITSTGRLSSTKPNLQNQPREATFPIRKVFVSRWKDGQIIETDFAQLEFRAAVHLARCEKGRKDILDGIDIHNQTAKIITEAGFAISRQDAKSRSFKPLYGGVTGNEAEREYYKAFLKEIYTGINRWHKELEEEAISKKIITIETGRQFIFPDVERAWHGGATRKTQIVNYPVQAFATADLVLCAIIRLSKEMKQRKLKSLLVLNVHDSVIADVLKDEMPIMIQLMSNLGKYAEEELKIRYYIDMFVPLTVETKYGTNLMELKKVA